MAYCSSYYLYQRYEKRGDQDWIPSYPNVYSIDGEGSEPLRTRIMYDTDCGWITDTEVQYRTLSGTPYCSGETGYDKYVNETYQVSYDGGITWSTTGNADVLVERNSTDCGYVPPIEPIYRWTVITPTSDPSTYYCDECQITPIYRWANSGTTCIGYDKYQRAIKQVSYDNGSTWENVSPEEYSATTLIEANSEDCGYVPPYSGQYLTLEAIDSTAFSYLKVSGGTILYSLDNGATWTENYSTYNDHQHITKTPVIPAGSKVMFKGVGGADNNILPITSSGDNNYSARFKVYGNVMSMVHGDNFSGKTNLSGMCFSHMFTKCSGLTDAGNLILPALNLSERRQDSDAYGCYALMFNQCTSLTTAPELPATGLTSGCYTQMFYGCTSLNYIKCLATDISSTICTSRWVDGVASSGTFVKNASTTWPSGISGIPDNWTVQNA